MITSYKIKARSMRSWNRHTTSIPLTRHKKVTALKDKSNLLEIRITKKNRHKPVKNIRLTSTECIGANKSCFEAFLLVVHSILRTSGRLSRTLQPNKHDNMCLPFFQLQLLLIHTTVQHGTKFINHSLLNDLSLVEHGALVSTICSGFDIVPQVQNLQIKYQAWITVPKRK